MAYRVAYRTLQRRLCAAVAARDGSGVINGLLIEGVPLLPGRQSSSCQLHSLRVFTAGSEAARSSRGPVSYASLGLTALTGVGILLYFRHLQDQKLKETLVKTDTAGKAAIGGPFSLVNQEGKPFSEKDLLGRFSLLYFGFTFCPDICPDELEKMTAAVHKLEKDGGGEVQPVFISLDPERDTVPQVKQYVAEFHPRLIGLTGTPEQVREAARQYRVYYSKTNEDKDYLVDHSIIMYLVDPAGEFVTFYGKNYTADELATSMRQHIREWERTHPAR